MTVNRGIIMTEEERLEIINWFCQNFYMSRQLSHNRRDYICEKDDIFVPPAFWAIKKRLVEREGLEAFEKEPEFRDFVGCILPGGKIHKHRDHNYGDRIHIRFNCFLQIPSAGFRTYYDGNVIDARERGYVICRSGLEMHWTDVNADESPRLSLSFGFLIPSKEVERIYKAVPPPTNM
jgi:hypothetical protein